MATSQPVPFVPNTNAGTNAPVRNPNSAARDDNTVSSQVDRAVRDSNADRIIPQDNVLSQYASYTYNISIYIMSPKDYNEIVRTKRFKIPGNQLLISSGGAPNSSTAGTGTPGGNTGVTGVSPDTQANATAGRNQFFPLDFYINDVRLTTLQPGKGTRSPHSNTTLNFKIVEPNGISLLDNLYAATQAYVGKKQNYGAQNFCMVIKFYGYDDTGKLVQAQGLNTGTGSTAVIEKWIPFQFTGIKFRIANKLTEYDCSAVCVSNNIATGQMRGTIPYNVEINAPTLKEILSGNASYTTAAAAPPPTPTPTAGTGAPKPPPKATAAPKPTIVSGLIEALNQYQELLTGTGEDAAAPGTFFGRPTGVFDVADVYDIVFTDPKLENASVLPPTGISKAQNATLQPTTANQQVNGAVQTGAANSKTTSATAGTSIIQFLDQTIRNSKYIYDQQLILYTIEGEEIEQQKDNNQGMDWYRIGVKTEPISYDAKRRDYAYKITYIVSPYRINEIKGPNFPSTKFRGTHKKYLYWFTGLNSEVLSYEQDFNYLYYVVVNGGQQSPQTLIDFREESKYGYQTRSNESDQGVSGKVNEPGANAAQQLYSPADLARAKLSILGDPAWIHQGEFWFGVTEGTGPQQPFFPDGSINTEVQEPLFEIGFNKPVDYDLQSGRMEVGSTDLGANRYVTGEGGNGLASQSYIYRAVSVVSTFANGRFTQDIEGVLVTFPRSAIKANTDVDSQYTETEQETERLLANLDVANAARTLQNALNRAATSTPGQPSSPTTASARTNPAAPAPTAPSRPPTSSGQPVGNAAPASNTNTQSGGTTQRPADLSRGYTLSEQTFRQRDPAGARAYREFKTEKEKEISAAESARLTAQAQRNNNGTVTPRERELIDQRAQTTARQQSDRLAVEKFAPQIQAVGAITFPGTISPAAQQGAAIPRAPQTSSREP
jgi:hypothetical protein